MPVSAAEAKTGRTMRQGRRSTMTRLPARLLPAAFIALVTAVVTLGACSTAPRPKMVPLAKAGYGYQEVRLGPDQWEVSYYGVVRYLSPDDVEREPQLQGAIARSRELALWRAAQLVQAAGGVSFSVVRERVNTAVRRRPGYYEDPFWPAHPHHPYYYRHRYFPGAYYPHYRYSPPVAYGRAWVTLVIRSYAGAAGRYRAAAYRARMRAKYGPSIPPPR